MKKLWKCLLSGALAGAANGLFGAGGGMILVPFFVRVLKVEPETALPTSVAVILPLCVASSLVYMRGGGPGFAVLWPFLLGGLAGGVLGGLIFEKLPTLLLRRALGLMIVYGAVRAIFF